jgi:hypothetical protein
VRLALGKDRPDNGWDVLSLLLTCALIVMALSLPFVLLAFPPEPNGWFEWPYHKWPFHCFPPRPRLRLPCPGCTGWKQRNEA